MARSPRSCARRSAREDRDFTAYEAIDIRNVWDNYGILWNICIYIYLCFEYRIWNMTCNEYDMNSIRINSYDAMGNLWVSIYLWILRDIRNIYIYVWDIYNVLQYGITMLYMEYYMERPLTMDIGIDTHETMGYLWIVVYLWILWDMNIIRNGWNHTWTQYSYSWKVYGPTLNNLCLFLPSMHMYTVYTPWRFFQSQHWKQIKKALHVQAGKPRSKKDDQAHEPYYIPYITYMNHITMLDMEYIYIYIY